MQRRHAALALLLALTGLAAPAAAVDGDASGIVARYLAYVKSGSISFQCPPPNEDAVMERAQSMRMEQILFIANPLGIPRLRCNKAIKALGDTG